MDVEELISQFVRLTEDALSEPDDEAFIEIIKARDGLLESIMEKSVDFPWVKKEHVEMEKEILRRLESIKTKVLKEMDNLSMKKRAIASYQPKFPFPPMPAFLDKEE
ncbi:MAG: hypothetical protein NZ583_06080 [Desulfobacterota bacterium]|nr:hypothetical protein [Thermodesulfobacteriota bacterium]MDW8002569.1 hypothetical protein [Deltaproteobacteria bacterium]